MLWFFRIIGGYLTIKIYGDNSELLLNLAARNGITLWNLRCKSDCITGNISLDNFKLLRKIIRKKRIKIHILSKHGIPFFTYRYKKRAGFIAGIALYFAVIVFLSGYIWNIKITGNTATSDSEIMSVCKELGIKEGCKKKDIDTEDLPLKLLLKTENLSWCSMNIEGCLLTVNVSQTKNMTDTDKTPSNLKAACDGKITKIDVQSGNVLVKVGDTVKKGDLLVSGINENMSSTVFVKSKGEIYADTEREISYTDRFNKSIKIPTGKYNTDTVFSFFTVKIPLFIGDEKNDYKSEFELNNLKLFGEKLPIKLYKRRYIITKNRKITQSEKEIIFKLENKIREYADNLSVKSYSFAEKTVVSDSEKVTVKQKINCVENIAKEESIILNSSN